MREDGGGDGEEPLVTASAYPQHSRATTRIPYSL
jgi:hypothetical protein